MSSVFISYRRGDSIATAGRIRDRLVQEYGRDKVFVDVDDIPHGRDFVEVLESKVAQTRVLLAIIGPGWLEASDEQGRRRLDQSDDFVAIEIASALARKQVAVIPVLVDGARMPTADELTERLKPLARRNAIELRNSQFGSDAARLIGSINAVVGAPRIPLAAKLVAWAGVLLLLIAGVWAASGPIRLMLPGPVPPQAEPKAVASAPVSVTPRPAARPSPPSPASPPGVPSTVESELQRLGAIMAPAAGKVRIGLRGGNRVRLGDQIVFEVGSDVAGRLIVVDINAAGEVAQIFPNRFLASEALASVAARSTTTIPGPGYGFSGFKAVEPVGNGRLVALVVPAAVPMAALSMVKEQGTKGFEPVNAPEAYLDQIVRHAREHAGGAASGADWGFALVEYEIVR